MRKAFVISFSNLKTDNRVQRQLRFLQELNFEVTVASNDGFAPEGIHAIKLKPMRLDLINKLILSGMLLLRFYSMAYHRLYGRSLKVIGSYDLFIANDIEALPLAFSLKKDAKVIFDAHEYAPRHFEDRLGWRIFFQGFNNYLCKKYIPQVDGMITVGQRIADEYLRNFGVKPVLVTNAPDYVKLKPKKTDASKIRLIHQGSANPSRKLELMVDMVDMLDERYELDLMLLKPPPSHRTSFAYYQKLEKLLTNHKRVRLIPPTPSDKLIEVLHEYDIGIILIPPVNFNYANTLPNKFFECIQARVALAIAPTPEIADLTKQYDIGVVARDFTPQSLAKELKSLTAEQIDLFKVNLEKAANDFNAEENKEKFQRLIESVLRI